MGQWNWSNLWLTAGLVAGLFFPQRKALGLDSRESTPELVRIAMHLAGDIRSYERAATALRRVLGHGLSPKTIERLVQEVGEELRQSQESSTSQQEVVVPKLAVVSCDGGRLHTREPGHGPGVFNPQWRETKNASFERMQASAQSPEDPCPQLPETYRHVEKVASLAESATLDVKPEPEERAVYKGPKRILRTCLSSLAKAQDFGRQMRREAARRRFFEAEQGVFIGDGLPWNWSIWRQHFSTYTPILDFIHAVQYLYAAAKAWETSDAARWSRYLELAEACWQGRVAQVIEQLHAELAHRGLAPDAEVADDSPHQPLVAAARYLHNNRKRMDYPRYRRQGFPITSAPMESLVKQINQRVKGTEMFWNDPTGAEPILQLRAASLSEDDRLDYHLRHRPGSPFTRRSTLQTAA
jgi:hypothetical protein